MSSFLNRLRAWDRWEPPVQGWGEVVKVVNAPKPVSLSECAAEIERLNAEIARLREALQEANRGLEIALCWSDNDGTWVAHEAVVKSSKAALAALAGKEEK